MSQQQDILLIDRLKENDNAAFDELYLKYFKVLCANAFFFLRNENEAKDLVQTLFLDIWEKKLYEHFHKDVKGYLFFAVKNRCLNFIKSRKVKDARAEMFNRFQGASLQKPEEPEDMTGHQDRLESLLADMKGQKKAALTMVYFKEKKYSEAAEELGIGVNSLKTHLKSALKTLRLGMIGKK
ncbi:sigma-70 family RNA polymerase sigma factor [Niabella pedocola]|uniref:Sigma-70 family RNA polymerase sigma factor n=1 Tax=Niabella pedocola TaxID=1752077 RepID=A0ABS8PY41_9BACT|nr:sigma-70 family RNA polymerase sigma factor [Niabella pedocola]MCD2425800.1 sigma-70 family RNA polymerase sigma factor [Niabella pedocola]